MKHPIATIIAIVPLCFMLFSMYCCTKTSHLLLSGRSMKDDDAAPAGHRLDNDNSLELTDRSVTALLIIYLCFFL